ncbi:hypothetical protein RRF57_003033 [Xylaria bambusicola]|uniref:Uncharacterized protein n=1 Tax=Xylaria bambusicola TaxID=326684 RepID=A0AAN7UFG9_9PEZI
MYGSTILATFLGASTVFAAPTWPLLHPGLTNTVGRETVADYFNLLAQKIDIAKLSSSLPKCDVSKAKIPTCKFPHNKNSKITADTISSTRQPTPNTRLRARS